MSIRESRVISTFINDEFAFLTMEECATADKTEPISDHVGDDKTSNNTFQTSTDDETAGNEQTRLSPSLAHVDSGISTLAIGRPDSASGETTEFGTSTIQTLTSGDVVNNSSKDLNNFNSNNEPLARILAPAMVSENRGCSVDSGVVTTSSVDENSMPVRVCWFGVYIQQSGVLSHRQVFEISSRHLKLKLSLLRSLISSALN